MRFLLVVAALGAVASTWGQAYATNKIAGLKGAKLANVLSARAAIAKHLTGRMVRIALVERRQELFWSAQAFTTRGVLLGVDLSAKDGKVDRRYDMSATAAAGYPAVTPRATLETAVRSAQKSQSGTVIEVRLDKFNSKPVWSVHLVDAKARRWGVLIDARTGKVVTGR